MKTFHKLVNEDSNDLVPYKKITGYTDLARFVGGLEEDPVGEIKRLISGPYASSPDHPVFKEVATGKNIFWVEVAHRRYNVYEVPATSKIYPVGSF